MLTPTQMFDLWLDAHDRTGSERQHYKLRLQQWSKRREVAVLERLRSDAVREAIPKAKQLAKIVEIAQSIHDQLERERERQNARLGGRGREPRGRSSGTSRPSRKSGSSRLNNDFGHWSADVHSGLAHRAPAKEAARPDRCSNCGALIAPGAAHDCR